MTTASIEQPEGWVEGPSWAPHGLEVRAGRFPLSVESHLLNMTSRLVPGATTVTTVARSYGLHGVIALEAESRGLSVQATRDLLRRCEVVVAGASTVHPDPATGPPHGFDKIRPSMEAVGALDVAGLAAVEGGYSDQKSGFLGPYLGSELTLQILQDNSLVPGPRVDESALREGFDGLFRLADTDRVTLDQLGEYPNLAVGAARRSADGVWLRNLLCSVGLESEDAVDRVRRSTIRLLARSVVLHPSASVTSSFRDCIASGDLVTNDPVLAGIEESQAWRGTLFRHDAVGAWRKLWSWVVGEITDLMPPAALRASMAGSLPDSTLRSFISELPDTTTNDGIVLPAEDQLRAQNRSAPSECLGLLCLSARRTEELTGTARSALVGDEKRVAVLSPLWMQSWIEDNIDHNLSDLSATLVQVLLDRANRIAFRKMRINADGRMWLPTLVHERNGMLYKIGDESSRNVGLRIEQLAGLLSHVDVLDRSDGIWRVTDIGEAHLEVAR